MEIPARVRDAYPRRFLESALKTGIVGLATLCVACVPSPPSATDPAPSVAVSDAERELVHDHTPHHGGVVGMVDDRHVEALCLADGTLRVYLTDRWRKPLPLDRVSGSVTVGSEDAASPITLQRATDCLETTLTLTSDPTVEVRIDLASEDGPLEIEFALPIGRRSGGAVGVPLEGCVPPSLRKEEAPARDNTDARPPRCTLEFATEVSALATTPDARRLLLAAVDVGASAWRLPAVTLELGLDAPPALVMSAPEAPHREAANAIVTSPDSSRAVLALEGRLLLYRVADGALTRELGGARGIVQDVDWSDNGRLLLVSRFYERNATLLSADTGTEVARLPVADEVAAVALGPASTLAAVGTRNGEIAIFDVASARRLRSVRTGSRAVEALAFLRPLTPQEPPRLVSAGADGALRIFDVSTGQSLAERRFDAPLYRIAVADDHRTFATGDRVGRVRLHDHDGAVVETLTERREHSSVLDLAFAGMSLVVSDSDGRVAVWDLAPH